MQGMHARSFVAKLILAAFVLAALFGIYGMVSLSHAQHGSCPSSPNQHSLCATPLEHLGHWQSVFTTTLPGQNLASLLLLLLLPFLVLRIGRQNSARDKDCAIQHVRVRYREKLFFPSPLQEAFSNGILNPKVH